MKRFNIKVPEQVNYIIQELEKCGHEAYMVGGGHKGTAGFNTDKMIFEK